MGEFFDIFDGGPDWVDWAIIGPLSEEMAEKERERRRLEDELDEDDEIPW